MYTLVSGGEEDLDIIALMETRGLTSHPPNIISFNGNCCSALASGSQVVSVVSGAAEDGAVKDCHMPSGHATTSGVTEVVAMAEVSVTDLLCIYSN